MKRSLLLFIIPLFTFFITSCKFKETMVIKEDGSGTISFTIDASEMLALNDSLAIANDSIMSGSFGIKTDRSQEGRQEETLSFEEFFEDEKNKLEIEKLPKEEQEIIMGLKNVKLKTVMDKETSESTYNIVTNFDDIDEVHAVMEGANYIFTASEGGGGDDFIPYIWNNNTAEVSYFYDGKKFIKEVIPGRQSATVKKSTFNMFPYTISYTFPKEIKYVSHKEAVISNDKKTVTVTYNLEEYLDNVEHLSIEVRF